MDQGSLLFLACAASLSLALVRGCLFRVYTMGLGERSEQSPTGETGRATLYLTARRAMEHAEIEKVAHAMFQPRVKLEFVRRYCPPQEGWHVCVDIDPSEEGRTGSPRKSNESQGRQKAMAADASLAIAALKTLDVNVGDRKRWCHLRSVPYLEGDPDVVAYDIKNKRCIVAEIEGVSSGQPEQKLYKAIGQMVRTVSNLPQGWNTSLVIVVFGEKIADHLQRAHALAKLGIAGLALTDDTRNDRWMFGNPLRLFRL